ncbi:MAG: hypothetical protein DRG78_09125 [Epsilonproteobacteria bacterium]|nr:MAG: hypothetical protein DRG78_09125 [Campylobacterota bacterium]
MDNLFLSILTLFGLAVVSMMIKQFKPSMNSKQPAVKKSEIILGYKKHLDTLSNKDEKIKFLKEINQELSRNIFFDQDELKKAIEDLTAYSFK